MDKSVIEPKIRIKRRADRCIVSVLMTLLSIVESLRTLCNIQCIVDPYGYQLTVVAGIEDGRTLRINNNKKLVLMIW